MPTRDAERMRAKRAVTGNIYDKARSRALTRLAKLHPSDFRQLVKEETAILTRAAERAARDSQ